jgi:hypothetical protein
VWQARARRSLERAADFSWDESARRLVEVAEEAVAIRRRNKRGWGKG